MYNSQHGIAIQHRLAEIKKRIENACINSGRNPDEVRLLLATKTVPAELIKIAIDGGETLLGENKVQELRDKDYLIGTTRAERHFIGHLQSNKVKDVLKYANCIQSVDRMSIVEALDKQLNKEGRALDIMVQVNTSFEDSKFGLSPENAIDFIREVSKIDTLRITGLMTIGLFSAENEKVRPSFTLLRNLKEEVIKDKILPESVFRHLSMGMSNDLETAIKEGATIVRVGTAIFGNRAYPDSYYWNENK